MKDAILFTLCCILTGTIVYYGIRLATVAFLVLGS